MKYILIILCMCMWPATTSSQATSILTQLAICMTVIDFQIRTHVLLPTQQDPHRVALHRLMNMRYHVTEQLVPQLNTQSQAQLQDILIVMRSQISDAFWQGEDMSSWRQFAQVISQLDATCEPLNIQITQ
jgi:hypothetical protein